MCTVAYFHFLKALKAHTLINLVIRSSEMKPKPFQVVAIISSRLDFILTVAVSSLVFLTPQITSKEYHFASPHWQGTGGGDSQVAPAVAESLWAVQTFPRCALEISSPACNCLLPMLPFFALPHLLASSAEILISHSFHWCVILVPLCVCVRAAFRSPSNSTVPFLCLSASELGRI